MIRWGVLVRGMLMGIAEVVPGVSGGTIAFVSGIYDELLRSLAAIRPASVLPLLRGDFRQFAAAQHLDFLLPLFAGMVLSVLAFARLIHWLLLQAPPLVWGFFFGLIVYSIWHLGRGTPIRFLLTLGPLGIVLGFAVSAVEPGALAPPSWFLVIGGALAVCAWLLPAVSGSFVLLALGLYEPVIAALAQLQWLPLLLLGTGCVLGVLLFSRGLAFLMTHYRPPLLALLTGFMVGALLRLWPWQAAGDLLLPTAYAEVTGTPALVPGTLTALMLGALCVAWLGRIRS